MIEIQRLDVADDSGAEAAMVLALQEAVHGPVPVALVLGDGVSEARRGHFTAGACSMTAGSATTASGGLASISIFTPAIVGATLALE